MHLFLGDSKCVIEWLIGYAHLDVLNLVAWKLIKEEAKNQFEDIKLRYIYREYTKVEGKTI